MKNLLITTAVGVAMMLTACGGKDKSQMDDKSSARVEITDVETMDAVDDAMEKKPAPSVYTDADLAQAANSAQMWMSANAQRDGVVVTATGLQYSVNESGDGAAVPPLMGQKVKVHYEGKLTNGDVFDSSIERGTPAVFPVGGLIPGWNEALQMMRPGDIWTLYIPPALAYSEKGVPNRASAGYLIPPNSPLIFRLELIETDPQ